MEKEIGLIFKPEAKTIKQVFGNTDSYYFIPDYQRPYDWKNEQIEQLWDDLTTAVQDGDDTYFLGSTILIKTNDNMFEVVDGQKRLTTLTILFCVLRDLYLKNDNIIKNSIKSLTDNNYRLRFITQPQNQNDFEKEILDNVVFPKKEPTLKEREKNKFLNTALIFRDKLKTLKKDEIEKLVDFILNKVIMITITCSNKSFAIKLFQILNARGLNLSASDLIKSYLYGKCEETKRAQFIANWREIEVLSEQIDEDLADLFTYYEYFLLGKNPKKSLYEELENQFKNKEPNQVIYDFKKFVENYEKIYKDTSKLMFSFDYLPNQVYWKSILTTAKTKEFEKFEDLAKELKKLFYCNWISGHTTTNVKQLCFNTISWIKEDKDYSFIKNKIDTKIKKDKMIKSVFENLNDDAYGEGWTKPLLILIEYAQTDNSKLVFIEMDNKLHIDHILPEKWNSKKEWKELWNEQDAKNWLNKLGNLTLLSGKKNIAQQNDPPLKKKEMYEKGYGGKTAFEVSKPLIEIFKVSGWKVEDAKRRQDWVIQETEKLLDIKQI